MAICLLKAYHHQLFRNKRNSGQNCSFHTIHALHRGKTHQKWSHMKESIRQHWRSKEQSNHCTTDHYCTVNWLVAKILPTYIIFKTGRLENRYPMADRPNSQTENNIWKNNFSLIELISLSSIARMATITLLALFALGNSPFLTACWNCK